METSEQVAIAERLLTISEDLRNLTFQVADQSDQFEKLLRSITRLIGNDNDSPQ